MNVLFQIADYTGFRQEIFQQYFSPRMRQWAEHHGYAYRVVKGQRYRGRPNWDKLLEAKKLLDAMPDGEKVLMIDADCVVVRGEYFPPSRKALTYVCDDFGSHGTSLMHFVAGSWTRKVVNLLLDEDLYQKHKHEPLWQMWCDQAAWYTIAGIELADGRPAGTGDFCQKVVANELFSPDTRLTREELLANVEILPPDWSCASPVEERTCIEQWRRVNTSATTAIVRHFCGAQQWLVDYAKKPLFGEQGSN